MIKPWSDTDYPYNLRLVTDNIYYNHVRTSLLFFLLILHERSTFRKPLLTEKFNFQGLDFRTLTLAPYRAKHHFAV